MITVFAINRTTPVPTVTPTPTSTSTPLVTPTRTPTPTPSCTAPGSFLEGTTCYNFSFNVFLEPTAGQACTDVQNNISRVQNKWSSCCDYQSRFVNGNPSGCAVYDDNGDLAGDGWISDGCLSWEISNGIVISTAGQICSRSSLCCGTTPT
jgi:hypothetical protein